ncbi:MAG TPA: phosphoribosyl-ATP diphosphatase [Candidatus Cybelea sp.]|nr:phosphoribosyl-ATP diphosphatase [Candidatus Cybelea sp.]
MTADDTSLLDSLDFAKGGGLVPTIVCDAVSGQPRMLAYSTRESLASALRHEAGIYWSRSRGCLWRKGETSGNTQRLVAVVPDCDRDALIFYVEQSGPSCHLGAQSCFDGETPFTWTTLLERVRRRAVAGDASSYTRRLLSDDSLLAEKLTEEALELAEAQSHDEVVWECADLLYFMTVKLQRAGIGIGDVMGELKRRAR